jgi:hypothetical protein
MFVSPEEVIEYIHDKLSNEAPEFGIKFVGKYEEELLPEYPAIRVTPGPLGRDIHGTHTFNNEFLVDVWVYHARMSASHGTRSKEDLELCTQVRQLMHKDMTLGGNVVYGFFLAENPGIVNRPKGAAVVGTRMVWSGLGQERF